MSSDAIDPALEASVDEIFEAAAQEEQSVEELRFEARYRWVIYREMLRLHEKHPEVTDEAFDLLYEQIEDVVRLGTVLDNLERAQQDQQVMLAVRRAVTEMVRMLDSTQRLDSAGEASAQSSEPPAKSGETSAQSDTSA